MIWSSGYQGSEFYLDGADGESYKMDMHIVMRWDKVIGHLLPIIAHYIIISAVNPSAKRSLSDRNCHIQMELVT